MAMRAASPGLGLATALVRLSHLVQRVFSDVSREHGLPPQQLQLLCMLIDGPAGMSELCRLMNLERSGMTGLVDRVEKRRLIARASDPADRRACLVSLTGKGRRLAVAAHDDITTRLESMTEELDLGDRDCLVSVTTRLLAKHDPALVSDR